MLIVKNAAINLKKLIFINLMFRGLDKQNAEKEVINTLWINFYLKHINFKFDFVFLPP